MATIRQFASLFIWSRIFNSSFFITAGQYFGGEGGNSPPGLHAVILLSDAEEDG